MTEPLKLPLRVLPGGVNAEHIFIVDRDNHAIEMTDHRAEIIVAALTADASGVDEHIDWDAMDVRKVWQQMNRYVVYLETSTNRIKELERQLVKAADAEPTPAVVIPSVDYTQIPPEYAGKWVLIRITDQQVVRVGASPEDAMRGYDPESLDFVLTQVPDAEEGEPHD